MQEGEIVLERAPRGKSVSDYEANRMFLASVLVQVSIARPRDVEENRDLVQNVWYALGLAATLGYPVGVDRWGYAHIQLPFRDPEKGLLTWPVGHFDCKNPSASPKWLEATRVAIGQYMEAVAQRFDDKARW